MHTDKIYFITYYYSPTCFVRSSDHHQGVIREWKKNTIAQNAERIKGKEQQSHFLLLINISESFGLCLKSVGSNL